MAKMYTLNNELLIGTPEIRIGEKVYPIDDRQKTVKKIFALCEEVDGKTDFDKLDEIFKLAFAKNYKEIEALDLSWAAYQELFTLVLSAAMGEEPEEVKKRFHTEEE